MKSKSWTEREIETLIKLAEKRTSKELTEVFPERSAKAIARMIEKLREAGLIGIRDRDAVKRSYYQRLRSIKVRGN